MGGGASTYDYGFRIYNSALAKFLSVDPLSASYPWYTPYQFAGNKPIIAIDLDGLEEFIVIFQIDKNDPNLSRVDISKVSENNRLIDASNPSLGTGGVQYIYKDSEGNVLSNTRLPDFQSGSIEEAYMNLEITVYSTEEGKYGADQQTEIENGTTMTRREAMNPTTNGDALHSEFSCSYAGKSSPSNKASYTGQILFVYDLEILYNTDKSCISKEDLQIGNYDLALDNLGKLCNLLNNDTKFKTWEVMVVGSTDSSPSNYKDSNGEVCGNDCLGADRAANVTKYISDRVERNIYTSSVTSSSTEVVSTERSTQVGLIPPEKK
jgi:hypothetical protein